MTGPTPYWYNLVPQENVRPADLVPLSDKVARWAARDLGLRSTPTVVWFTRRQRRGATSRAWAPHYLRGAWPRPGEPPPPPYALTDEEALEAALNRSATPTLYGRVVGGYPSVVFLRTVRSPYTVARHLLHECRDVWQFANGWFPGRDLDVEEAQAEGDAEIYAGLAHPIMLQALARSSEVVR